MGGGLPARIPKRTGEVSLGCAEGQSEPDHCRAGEGGHCGLGVVQADREGGNLPCWLDWIQLHLGSIPVGVSVRDFPEV